MKRQILFRFSPNNEQDDANTIKNDDIGVSDALLLLRNSHISKNVNLLTSLGAGDVLVNVSCSAAALPELAKYVKRFVDAASGEDADADQTFAASQAEAAAHKGTFKALSEEIGIVSKALSLPLLEPLTTDRSVVYLGEKYNCSDER